MNIAKLLSTSDVMKRANVGRETLRYYEEKGLIRPISRSTAGYRQYASLAVETIAFIKNTQQAGFSLREIQELLSIRSTPLNTCDTVSGILSRKLNDINAELLQMQRKKEILETMVSNCCKVNQCLSPISSGK